MHTQPDKPKAMKRVALNMKATPELRAKVEAAADRSGLSIAQEVERRLMASIAEDERADTPEEAAFLRNARRVMDRVSQDIGEPWPHNHDAWGLVRSGILYLLEEMQPAKPAPLDADLSAAARDKVAEYDSLHQAWRARQYAAGKAAGEAYLALHATDDDQEQTRIRAAIAAADAAASEDEPKPDLSGADFAIWQRMNDRNRLVERATQGLVAVIPAPRR